MGEAKRLEESKKDVKVFIALPCYGDRIHASIVDSLMKSVKDPARVVRIMSNSFSILTRNFNSLYCQALNSRTDGVTHFCMIHDDIVINNMFWLDKMIDIMASSEADILSAIVPIKDKRGVTSTAQDLRSDDQPYRVKRYTMHELHKMPATFTADNLLLNSGLMLVDIRKEWAEKVCFQFNDAITKGPQGTYYPVGLSEDWLYSIKARAFGAKLFATREISVHHVGQTRYPNDSAWGSLQEDDQK